MKITKKALKQIIQEELQAILEWEEEPQSEYDPEQEGEEDPFKGLSSISEKEIANALKNLKADLPEGAFEELKQEALKRLSSIGLTEGHENLMEMDPFSTGALVGGGIALSAAMLKIMAQLAWDKYKTKVRLGAPKQTEPDQPPRQQAAPGRSPGRPYGGAQGA
jgi:hypothetical protein